MRDIKFRGKSISNDYSLDNWVIGTFYKDHGKYFMVEEITGSHIQINSDTLGQYTGLKDKNGEDIYESDIVEIDCGTYKDNDVVNFVNGTFTLHDSGFEPDIMPPEKDLKVIGNIYENSDLIK